MKPTLIHPRSLARVLVACLFATITLPASPASFSTADMTSGEQ